MIMVRKKYEVAVGTKRAMGILKKHGFRGLNPRTMRYQVIDKNAKCQVVKDQPGYALHCNKNLRAIAKRKGLIM